MQERHWTAETITIEEAAKFIDHSLLRPELTVADVQAGCETAMKYGVASVCCRPIDVPLCVRELAGTGVVVGTVVGFPHGSHTTATKVAETRRAIDDGAREFDMVIQIGMLRSGRYREVHDDIAAVVDAAAAVDGAVKVILETAFLTKEEKIQGAKLVEEAGAAFVKTSTGFAPSGATVEDVELLRSAVSPKVKVKAAHGIRTLDVFLQMINAGADRVGATATSRILDDLRARKGV
ncbi:deoxyribose-phosphate aldolase [Acidothermus cellulolyticus 11B]|uniref:Deoxyribose-phosphate aldolase n=1 Tax=Acidothermus cellulolyticus (strain ATCC 43068 / DSM 8971 / 11B) TaxID=351607 RepID=A0LSD5_ACIC1|nr:deoxyribose-phosphate aldolase [Acidothermus cellulolyticus]ABK52345.1 deoxyribose-phosphate aldolase [Acidothermus cellulolyticus 11B]